MSTKDLRASFREKLSSKASKRSSEDTHRFDTEPSHRELHQATDLINYKDKFADLTNLINALYSDFKLFILIEVQKQSSFINL